MCARGLGGGGAVEENRFRSSSGFGPVSQIDTEPTGWFGAGFLQASLPLQGVNFRAFFEQFSRTAHAADCRREIRAGPAETRPGVSSPAHPEFSSSTEASAALSRDPARGDEQGLPSVRALSIRSWRDASMVVEPAVSARLAAAVAICPSCSLQASSRRSGAVPQFMGDHPQPAVRAPEPISVFHVSGAHQQAGLRAGVPLAAGCHLLDRARLIPRRSPSQLLPTGQPALSCSRDVLPAQRRALGGA